MEKCDVTLENKKAKLRARGAQVCEECGIISFQPWKMFGKREEEVCGQCLAHIISAPITIKPDNLKK